MTTAAPTQIPDDLRSFLRDRRQLVYDSAECESGGVTLYELDSLPTITVTMHTAQTSLADLDPNRDRPGCYQIPAVDLVAEVSGDYAPQGLLIWLTEEGRFGTWDPDHDIVLVFQQTATWREIADDPVPYLNAQWEFEDLRRASVEYLQPWTKYPFR